MQLLADLFRDYGRTLVEALAACCFLAATWIAKRTQRWLLELLERERVLSEQLVQKEREHAIAQHNETLRTLAEASVNGEQPTLESLLSSAERDWSLESSRPSFVPPAGQLQPPERVTPGSSRFDWSDEELPTTSPETPASKTPLSEPPR